MCDPKVTYYAIFPNIKMIYLTWRFPIMVKFLAIGNKINLSPGEIVESAASLKIIREAWSWYWPLVDYLNRLWCLLKSYMKMLKVYSTIISPSRFHIMVKYLAIKIELIYFPEKLFIQQPYWRSNKTLKPIFGSFIIIYTHFAFWSFIQ